MADFWLQSAKKELKRLLIAKIPPHIGNRLVLSLLYSEARKLLFCACAVKFGHRLKQSEALSDLQNFSAFRDCH